MGLTARGEPKRDVYGAEITVRAGGKAFTRLINPGYSYASSNDPRAHFGLGPCDRYDAIEVRWPGGFVQHFPGGAADRIVEVHDSGWRAL